MARNFLWLVLFAIAIVVMPVAAEPLVIGESFTVDSRVLKERRRVNVYVPDGFGAAGSQPLPVLYMPDGGIREDFLHVAGLIQVSVGNGTMRPFMLVGVENTERRRDLTPPTANPEDRKIAPRVGGAAAFRTFIRDELMPEIAKRYPVTKETAIIGESLAGLFILDTLMVQPDMFNTYIVFDPSLWWNDSKMLKTDVEQGAANRTGKTVFIAASKTPGMGRDAEQLKKLLSGVGVKLVYEPMPQESHSSIYHPAALKALRTLFAPTAGSSTP